MPTYFLRNPEEVGVIEEDTNPKTTVQRYPKESRLAIVVEVKTWTPHHLPQPPGG